MAVSNALRQLWRDVRSQRLRTFLTVCGIVWGTVAVSLLLAFGDGFEHHLLKESAGLGEGIVITWPSRTSIPYEGLGKGRRLLMTEDDIDLIKRRSLMVDLISTDYRDNFKLQLGRKTLAVDVSGVHPSFSSMRNVIPAVGGRFINPLDMERKRRVAFLGDELKENLFGSTDPVGQTIRLGGSPFTVIGVMKTKRQNSSYSGRDKEKVFIPATTMLALTGRHYVDLFIFTSKDVERTAETTEEVRGILAGKHRFHPDDQEALATWDVTEGARFLKTFMLAFKIFLGVVGSLTLVVGGIGVSNIMNVVVEERTREIGIKMALGARPKSVLRQFLLETALVTGTGGLIGLAITLGLCAAAPALPINEFVGVPVVSPHVAGLTALLLGTIGLVAGYFPARTAARLDPVVAMKM
jgi:putative ABC transport system permease protein